MVEVKGKMLLMPQRGNCFSSPIPCGLSCRDSLVALCPGNEQNNGGEKKQ